METGIKILTGVYLLVMAVVDKRTKSVPVIPAIVLIFVFIMMKWIQGEVFIHGLWIGLILYLVSKLTKGSVGEGDALVYLLTGVALGFFRNFELLVCSLFLAALAGIVLIFTRHVGRNYTLPFIPFTAAAYGLVVWL